MYSSVQYMKACGGRGSAPSPAGELIDPPVKHTSLHNRRGVLKCSKTHLQQTRISTPRAPATGSALEHNEQGGQLSNTGPVRWVKGICGKDEF